MLVTIIQADNRPVMYYLELTKKVNEYAAETLGYNYSFIPITEKYTKSMHAASAKIHVLHEYLRSTKDDIVIFLDTDAWVNNTKYLDRIVRQLAKNPTKHGCYSRDTYVRKNTYINSGAFVLKVNDYTRQMYVKILENFSQNSSHHKDWPFDQYYISDYVYEHRKDFIIYKPEVFNTPVGIVLRHNWNKNEKMYVDLHEATTRIEYDSSPSSFIDSEEYPNEEDGIDYIQRFPELNAPASLFLTQKN